MIPLLSVDSTSGMGHQVKNKPKPIKEALAKASSQIAAKASTQLHTPSPSCQSLWKVMGKRTLLSVSAVSPLFLNRACLKETFFRNNFCWLPTLRIFYNSKVIPTKSSLMWHHSQWRSTEPWNPRSRFFWNTSLNILGDSPLLYNSPIVENSIPALLQSLCNICLKISNWKHRIQSLRLHCLEPQLDQWPIPIIPQQPVVHLQRDPPLNHRAKIPVVCLLYTRLRV